MVLAKRLVPTTVLATLVGAGVGQAQTIEYYHLDPLGSVRAVTAQGGQVVERHDYLPFGEEWCGTQPCGASGGQPKHFTGKERDLETGLDYFGARYSTSNIARFTSVDPYLDFHAALEEPQQWNRYTYALNNPYRYVDPDGRHPVIIQMLKAVWSSPAGQQARQFMATQGANAWMAAMRLMGSPAAQEAVKTGAELASGSQLPPSTPLGAAVPLLKGTANRELFREAFEHLRASTGSASQKADLFEGLARQITEKTAGSWAARRVAAADGSQVFIGGAGETLVIDVFGTLYRGRADTGLVAVGRDTFRPLYEALQRIE